MSGAYRINFFDEIIESIKSIDLSSMLSVDEREAVTVYPATDVLFSRKDAERVRAALSAHGGNPVAASLSDRVRAGAAPAELAWALVFSEDNTSFLFDCFGDSSAGIPPVVVFDEPKIIADKIDILTKEFREG